MSRLGVLITVGWIAMIASARADGQVWVLDDWPADAGQIPCSAWSRTADGTWLLHGTVKLGASEITDAGVKGDAAAHLLDRECGKKK